MTIINILLLIIVNVSSKSLNRMLLLSSDSGGTHSDDSKAAPATITTAPTITTLDPTIITSDPTIITSVPTIITSDPTVITSAPTIITSAPTYYPTIITSAPTTWLITAELNCAELTCTDITFLESNGTPLGTQNQCEDRTRFEGTLEAQKTRKYCFEGIDSAAEFFIRYVGVPITGLILDYGYIFTLTDFAYEIRFIPGQIPPFGKIELCLTNESEQQGSFGMECIGY